MTNALTDEEVEYIEASIIEEQLEAIIGRNVFGVTPVDAGTLTYTYNKLTEMSAAEKIAEGAEFPYDNVSKTPTSAYIDKLGKGFQLSRESILAARKGGYDINTQNARSAVRQVAELEEAGIFTELESSATTEFIAHSDGGGAWSAADATPSEDLIDIRTTLRDYNFKFNTLLIQPSVYKYLIVPNSYGITAIDDIKGLGIDVVETKNLVGTTHDAIACQKDKASLVVAEDIATEGEYVLANQAFNNQVFERVVPIVWDDDAFVKCDFGITTS